MENFKLAVAKNNGSFFEYDIICNNELARLRPLKTEDMAAFARFTSGLRGLEIFCYQNAPITRYERLH